MPSQFDLDCSSLLRFVAIGLCLFGMGAKNTRGQNYRSSLVLAPYSLSFGDVLLGKTSEVQTITLLNTGPVRSQIDKITITAPFYETSDCPVPPASLGENERCGIEVSFKPSEAKPASGSVSVFHDGNAQSLVVSLTGSGTLDASAVKFSPSSLSFGEQKVGNTSSAQTITLTNAGTRALVITNVSTEGDFTISPVSTCEKLGNALGPNADCTIVVTFTPLGAGERAGAITVMDDAENSPQRVPLSGPAQEP